MTPVAMLLALQERGATFCSSERFRYWKATLAKFFGLEILSQLLRLTCALIIVRSLPKDEYAWYSLANGFWGVASLLSITGAGTGLLALGGQFLQDETKFAQVVKAASQMRLYLLLFSIPVVLPAFGWLLIRNGCPIGEAALLLVLALIVLTLEMSTQLAGAILALRGRYDTPQIAECMNGTFRLVGVFLLFTLGWLRPSIIMLVTSVGVALAVKYVLLPASQLSSLNWKAEVPHDISRRFLSLTLNGLPTSLSLAFEGQIAMLLLAYSGQVGNVADIGALARLSLVLAVPMAVTGKLIIPRLARESSPARLLQLWIGGILYSVAIGIALLMAAWFFGHQMLLLIGGQYKGLQSELLLYSGSIVFSAITYQVATINLAKGWVRHSWIRPAIVIGMQSVVLLTVSVDSLRGAIMLMYAATAGNLLVELFLVMPGLRSLKKR